MGEARRRKLRGLYPQKTDKPKDDKTLRDVDEALEEAMRKMLLLGYEASDEERHDIADGLLYYAAVMEGYARELWSQDTCCETCDRVWHQDDQVRPETHYPGMAQGGTT